MRYTTSTGIIVTTLMPLLNRRTIGTMFTVIFLFFQLFKKGSLATLIGVMEPHMDDGTKFHPNMYIFIPRFSQCRPISTIFRDSFDDFIHEETCKSKIYCISYL